MKVYVLLETIDLGDHILGVFKNKNDAELERLNTIKDDPLSKYIDRSNTYYIQEFEVK